MQDAAALKKFERWLKAPEQGIYLAPSLVICKNVGNDRTGYRVITTQAIEEDEIIMKVPKTSLLSPRNSAISNLLAASDLIGMPALALCFLYEKRQGRDSPWAEYIQMIPDTVPITKLWSKEEKALLSGTEVEEVGGLTLSDFKEMFKDLIEPFLRTHEQTLGSFAKTTTFDQFCQAMSIVGSRAFDSDVYHDMVLCPFADMLDHGVTENVHFQTDIDVCAICGVKDGCEHVEDSAGDEINDAGGDTFMGFSDAEDDEDSQSNRSSTDSKASADQKEDVKWEEEEEAEAEEEEEDEEEDCCEFIAMMRIEAGSEIINTYGHCPNSVLMARYGFALPENPYDRLTLSLGALMSMSAKQAMIYREWWDLNGENLLVALRPELLQAGLWDIEEDEEDEENGNDRDSLMPDEGDHGIPKRQSSGANAQLHDKRRGIDHEDKYEHKHHKDCHHARTDNNSESTNGHVNAEDDKVEDYDIYSLDSTDTQDEIEDEIEANVQLKEDEDEIREEEEEEDEDEEDEDEDLEDHIYLTSTSQPSTHLLVFLFITTLTPDQLAQKSGAEVKVHCQMLLSAWSYVRPGRMPLPRYMFHTSIHHVVHVLRRLLVLVKARTQRSSVLTSQKLPKTGTTVEIAAVSEGNSTDESGRRERRRLVNLIRAREERVLCAATDACNCMLRACTWILERE